MDKLHKQHSDEEQHGSGMESEENRLHWKDVNRPFQRNCLKKSSLSKSMPSYEMSRCTAEDEEVSSMRTFRYLKLDSNDTTHLPPPRKFADPSKPSGSLKRSKSAQDFAPGLTLCPDLQIYMERKVEIPTHLPVPVCVTVFSWTSSSCSGPRASLQCANHNCAIPLRKKLETKSLMGMQQFAG